MTSDFNTTIGISITIVNIAALIVLSVNIYKSYTQAIDIRRSKSDKDLNFYFFQMFISLIFCSANCIALYTGIQAYIIHPSLVNGDIVMYRFLDRCGMLCTAIALYFYRRGYNPFTDID